MNIRQAKEAVRDTIRAYLSRDDSGHFLIPVERQRPLLLIGPPGIGKTAIMEQVARECGIGLVSYTITHHTRQSAIGLPVVSEREYDGHPMRVTEYTMSEIIASIYDEIERTGLREGILFLDEINCVSETLMPTMLQFLQYKTFGTHRVPEGYIIVTAGNPPRYNRSVRDFDIVTLDRVRRIEITEDLEVWREYAYDCGIHGAIMAYLEIHPDRFYSIHADMDGMRFVTARGWEDLSRLMLVHERKGLPVDRELMLQFLQDGDIAEDFATYYGLYGHYSELFCVADILSGTIIQGDEALTTAPFDEKLSLLGLLTDALAVRFRTYVCERTIQEKVLSVLQRVSGRLRDGDATVRDILEEELSDLRADTLHKEKTGRYSPQDIRVMYSVQEALKYLSGELNEKAPAPDRASEQAFLREWFSDREKDRQQACDVTGEALTNAFTYLARTFGEGQELVLFLTELGRDADALRFVHEHGNEAYEHYNELLLLGNRRRALQAEALALL